MKSVKKVLIFLLMVAVVVVVLVIATRMDKFIDTTPGGSSTDPLPGSSSGSADPQPDDDGTQPDSGSTQPDDGGTQPDSGGTQPDSGGTQPDSGGTQPDSGGTQPNDGPSASGFYTMTADAGFTCERAGLRHVYIALQDGSARMEVRYIPDTTVAAEEPAFLDGYLQATSTEFLDNGPMGNSGVRATRVTGSGGGYMADAYLTEAGTGVVSVVIIYGENTDSAIVSAMYAMLDTFTLTLNW